MTQPRWLAVAWADLGIAETPGPGHAARVLRYYAEVGHGEIADDEVAWCAAFLGACLERAGISSTRSLMARSYLAWGDPIEDARPGAIAVFSRGFDPRLGHVGFVVGETESDLILLGGNQRGSVSVAAFARARLLGLRWPPASAAPPAALAADALFERALAHVLEMEGGYSDDPYDPGGPTNFGITLADFARDKGVALTPATADSLKAELRTVSRATVRRIFRDRYWAAASCPELPPGIAAMHFDAAVNQGVAGAARMLQEAVGAAIDGEIGPLTRAAALRQPVARTLALYADIRRRRYRALPHFWRFGKGWLRRVDAALALAIDIDRTMPSAPVPAASDPQPKEPPPMETTKPSPEQPAAAEPKWWGQSMTLWGVLLTTLSTVLPTIGPLFGVNITADLVTQLGEQIVLAGQAIAALVGTLMTVYGRIRASAPLERRQITMNM